MSKVKKLTVKQSEILEFLISYIKKNPAPPSIREIGDEFGINSTNGVFDHLNALVRKGYIHRNYFQARSITILRNPNGTEFREPINIEIDKLLTALGDYEFPDPIKKQMNKLKKMIQPPKLVNLNDKWPHWRTNIPPRA